MSPQPECPNKSTDNELHHLKSRAYKPAYKNKSESNQNQEENVPLDLIEVMEAWPQLADTMKKAILTIINAARDRK